MTLYAMGSGCRLMEQNVENYVTPIMQSLGATATEHTQTASWKITHSLALRDISNSDLAQLQYVVWKFAVFRNGSKIYNAAVAQSSSVSAMKYVFKKAFHV